MKTHFFTLLFLLSAIAAFAQNAGTLDQTYGKKGFAIQDSTKIYEDFIPIQTSALTSDNKLITFEYAVDSSDNPTAIKLRRFNNNGTVDATFGKKGIATYDLTDLEEPYFYSTIVLPSGKILVSGVALEATSPDAFDGVMLRFNQDGSIDKTFGTNGTKFIGEPNVIEGIIGGKLLSNGNIALSVVKLVNEDEPNTILLTMIDKDGNLVKSFGTDGVYEIAEDLTSPTLNFYSNVNEDSKGNIYISGLKQGLVEETATGAIIKVLSTGKIDETFGTKGRVVIEPTKVDNYIANLTLDFDLNNKPYVLFTELTLEDNLYSYLMNLDAKGSIITTFGTKGLLKLSDNDVSFANDMKVQKDGRILVNYAETDPNTFNVSNITARYNANGTLDQNFANKGKYVVTSDTSDFYLADIHIESNGKILITTEVENFDKAVSQRVTFRLSGPYGVDTQEETFAEGVKIYPNPARQTLNIAYDLKENQEQVTIEVLNLQGQIVTNLLQNTARNAGKNIENLDVSALNDGIYFLRLNTATQSMQYKIVKM